MPKKILFFLFLNIYLITKAQTNYTVASLTDFNTALNTATSGDTIEWENGVYSNINMTINTAGIIVTSETSGGVTFNGSSKVVINGDDVIFKGFQFIGGDIGTNHVARIYGSNVLFENINISEYTSYKYLIVEKSSQFTTIKNCNFEHRVNNPNQNIVSILINETQPGFHKIQFCSFKNFDGEPVDGSLGDAGVEAIRIGVSTTAGYESKSIVEYCYFTQCNGDGEIISHKGTECIYRYNTFEDNPEGELVLRHGDKGIVYGNFFLNGMGGVRIQEASDHVVYNNYFSGLTQRSLNLNASSSDRLDNILIAYNTFVNTDVIDIENHSTVEATNVTVANNIFSNPSSNDGLFEDLTGNETWIGNIAFGDLGVASSNDFTVVDPLLALNAEGYYTLASSSSVINAATSGYPALPVFTNFAYDNEILLDVLGSARPSTETLKDVGCQEYMASAVLKPHVTVANTGPDYLIDSSILSTTNQGFIANQFTIYPNPLEGNVISLKFQIEETSDVKIAIYDLSGNKLSNLIDASYNAGSYDVSNEVNLSSGVYVLYIELTSGANKASKVEKFVKM